MSLRLKGIRKKCSEEKYYEAIKYMAHTLTDRDRYQFIKQVSQYNIYLGAICATTCEYEKRIDSYIKKRLNEFFEEKQVTYYDKKTGQKCEYKKVIGKADIEMFIMASYEIDNFSAIKWAIYNHNVSINTFIKLGQKVTEAEFVDLLVAISKSKNQEKMLTMCRIRSALSQKENASVKKLLKYYWYENRQIFTYLADAFGWLPDLDGNKKYGEMIYAKCFEESDNSIAFNNVIINAISVNYREGLERLFRIIKRYGTDEVKKNLYMLFYMKLQNRLPVYKSDYKALERVVTLDKREIYLGKKTISNIVNSNCSSWINVFDLIFLFPFREGLELNTTNDPLTRNTYPINRYLEAWKDTSISRVIYTYFNTEYCKRIYLDDFVMLVSEQLCIEIPKVCDLLNEYYDEGFSIQSGNKSYFGHRWKSLRYPVIIKRIEIGKKFRLIYRDYDYIEHRFYVDVSEI